MIFWWVFTLTCTIIFFPLHFYFVYWALHDITTNLYIYFYWWTAIQLILAAYSFTLLFGNENFQKILIKYVKVYILILAYFLITLTVIIFIAFIFYLTIYKINGDDYFIGIVLILLVYLLIIQIPTLILIISLLIYTRLITK